MRISVLSFLPPPPLNSLPSFPLWSPSFGRFGSLCDPFLVSLLTIIFTIIGTSLPFYFRDTFSSLSYPFYSPPLFFADFFFSLFLSEFLVSSAFPSGSAIMFLSFLILLTISFFHKIFRENPKILFLPLLPIFFPPFLSPNPFSFFPFFPKVPSPRPLVTPPPLVSPYLLVLFPPVSTSPSIFEFFLHSPQRSRFFPLLKFSFFPPNDFIRPCSSPKSFLIPSSLNVFFLFVFG